MDFTLKQLEMEITQIENDLEYLRNLKKSVLYKNFIPEISALIKKLTYKKRKLNIQFKTTYANYLELADFVANISL